MNIVNFFKNIAENTHYNLNLDTLISKLPKDIEKAFLNNDTEQLKALFADNTHLANEIDVVQIS